MDAEGHRGSATPYDSIGVGYSAFRRPDARIAAALRAALGPARSVLDVGSGTGSYEPAVRDVVAVEPSLEMILQRPAGAAPVARALAEALPFRRGTFDAAIAVLTLHHWADHDAGLRELARVSRRQIVLTWDPHLFARFWLVADYLPEIATHEYGLATAEAVPGVLNVVETVPVPVPADCSDGFCGAYWRRPRSYLDPVARNAISAFSSCDRASVENAMARLAEDIETGRWLETYEHLLSLDQLDLGYRMLVCEGTIV
jgi:SAM-dependent methyltransferase